MMFRGFVLLVGGLWLVSLSIFFRSRGSDQVDDVKSDNRPANLGKGLRNIGVPQNISSKHDVKLVDARDSCDQMLTQDDAKLVSTLHELFVKKSVKSPILLFTTFATIEAVKLQLESAQKYTNNVLRRLIIFCAGDSACDECKKVHDKCVQDEKMSRALGLKIGANSLGTALTDDVDRAYLDIIWRKPELAQLAFLAHADSVLIVDTDGVWFADQPTFNHSVVASSEYLEHKDFTVDEARCIGAPVYRGAPLVLNSGTVYIRNDALGKALLIDWLLSRSKRDDGFCGSAADSAHRNKVMLDQDGFNYVACQKSAPYYGKIKGLSSNSVLLNSVHNLARLAPWFDICKTWFFHSTNCGFTSMKVTCMQKNLERKQAQCDTGKR